ncbi:MAG: hypothetical protein LRZ84_22840 [Desertifilum sp.]|nr:hypothetical protein [Desertifilum sp.]
MEPPKTDFHSIPFLCLCAAGEESAAVCRIYIAAGLRCRRFEGAIAVERAQSHPAHISGDIEEIRYCPGDDGEA